MWAIQEAIPVEVSYRTGYGFLGLRTKTVRETHHEWEQVGVLNQYGHTNIVHKNRAGADLYFHTKEEIKRYIDIVLEKEVKEEYLRQQVADRKRDNPPEEYP